MPEISFRCRLSVASACPGLCQFAENYAMRYSRGATGLLQNRAADPPGTKDKGMVPGYTGRKMWNQHILYGPYRTGNQGNEHGYVCGSL